MREIANLIYSFRVSRVRIPPLPPIEILTKNQTQNKIIVLKSNAKQTQIKIIVLKSNANQTQNKIII